MLRRNMTSAECQISDPKGRYLVFTLLFFQMPMMKTQGLNTKIITKKPKSARNCESRARCSKRSGIGTPNLFRNLRASAHFVVGTKRNTFRLEFASPSCGHTDFSRISDLFLKAQKDTTAATAAQPPREPEARNSRITSL